MPFRGKLADGVAVQLDLHHGFRGGFEVLAVAGRQVDGGQQAIVQRDRDEGVVLLLHLRQQAGGVALQDALHAPFGRAAAPALTGDPHQHAVTVPGVVELVVADVDVLAAVLAQGKAEAFAAATESGFDQAFVFDAADAVIGFFEHADPGEGREGDAELLFIGLGAQAEPFFKLAEAEGLLVGELLDEVRDRELHGCWGGLLRSGQAPGGWRFCVLQRSLEDGQRLPAGLQQLHPTELFG